MARTIGIGHQNFESLVAKDCFYIDKTAFIKEWWESEDVVTLITRPRRFGKTLNMSMVEVFFLWSIRDGEISLKGCLSGKKKGIGGFRALLQGNVRAMNTYMNRVALATFSYFDTGRKLSEEAEPERFYHGFVLGLMVELAGRYKVTSNRESGFGRYDVVLEPLCDRDDAVILEFKVHEPHGENSLEDTVKAAHEQMESKRYAADLEAGGIPRERIRSYGFAFEGKKVLIG